MKQAKRIDVVCATCVDLPEPDPDARLLAQAINDAGYSTALWPWDDPNCDWSRARRVVLRSTWNYPHHLAEFLKWAELVAASTDLVNGLEVIRWNSHKGYLSKLQAAGFPTVPTQLVRQGSQLQIAELAAQNGWSRFVIKPAVSASSLGTRLFGSASLGAAQRHLDSLTGSGDALVQLYFDQVEGYGERSMVCIDGELTHAIRKSRRFEGEQESVSESALSPAPKERELAERILAWLPFPVTYARVDMAPDAHDQPTLMELELVEPSLFLQQSPAALSRFVSAMTRDLPD